MQQRLREEQEDAILWQEFVSRFPRREECGTSLQTFQDASNRKIIVSDAVFLHPSVGPRTAIRYVYSEPQQNSQGRN